MHPSQQGIVPPVIKVRNAALLGPEIAHRGRQIEGPDAAPAQTYHRLHVEVKASHPGLQAHDGDQGVEGVDAKSIEGVADAGPQSFEIGPPIRDPAALDPQPRGARIEYR